MIRPTTIDLFAGAGGFTLGFEFEGFEALSAIELDHWAAETYSHNFPSVNVVQRDISEMSDFEIKSLRKKRKSPLVLIGGPPCQGFSHSNIKNKDSKDPRNSLFEQFLRAAKVLRPDLCVMENVPGLLKSETNDHQLVIDIIRERFESIGFDFQYKLLNAVNFGVPQFRERLFIIATNSEKCRGSFDWPEPTHAWNEEPNQGDLFRGSQNPALTLEEAIDDLPQIVNGDGLNHLCYGRKSGLSKFQKWARKKAPKELVNHEPMKHTKRIIERFEHISYGMSESDVPSKFAPRKRSSPDQQSEKSYSQNSRRQQPKRPCNTVVASSHTNFIHPHLHRNFTIRELARIQSFPDDFVFKGLRATLSKKLLERKGLLDQIGLDQRAQVGNAVPPLLAAALARSVATFLSKSV